MIKNFFGAIEKPSKCRIQGSEYDDVILDDNTYRFARLILAVDQRLPEFLFEDDEDLAGAIQKTLLKLDEETGGHYFAFWYPVYVIFEARVDDLILWAKDMIELYCEYERYEILEESLPGSPLKSEKQVFWKKRRFGHHRVKALEKLWIEKD